MVAVQGCIGLRECGTGRKVISWSKLLRDCPCHYRNSSVTSQPTDRVLSPQQQFVLLPQCQLSCGSWLQCCSDSISATCLSNRTLNPFTSLFPSYSTSTCSRAPLASAATVTCPPPSRFAQLLLPAPYRKWLFCLECPPPKV